MKARLLQFIDRLRTAGLPISPAETLDAARAVAVLGIEPRTFREAVAAAVVKDESDRDTFDDEFDRFFATPARIAGHRQRPPRIGSGGRAGVPTTPLDSAPDRPQKPSDREDRKPGPSTREREQEGRAERRRASATRSLLELPLKDMTPRQIDECDPLLRQLAERLQGRRRRRLRLGRHLRLDLRRTLRRSISSGGVPMQPQYRHRRPGKPDLVALCDLSHSVATASRFLLSLLSGAPALFRRVRLFGYVDSPVEIWLQDRHIVHDGPIDLYARSDFGKVLATFCDVRATLLTRDTLLLILGDARNNRRPPRADVLARMRSKVQRIAWLNPERRERWNTGDSVLAAYAPHCDDVLAAATVRDLFSALRAVTR